MAEAKKEVTFVLHNTVRRRHTRLKRMQAASRHRFKQYVAGAVRVTRNRPRPVKQSFIEKHLEELKAKEKAGLMEVRTPGGQLVDLNTMTAAPPPAPKPLPHPPMDSAANDEPMGAPMPIYREGKGVDEPVEPPALANDDIPEGIEPESPAPEPTPSGRGYRRKKAAKKRSSRK